MVTKNMKVRPGDYFDLKKEDLNLSADLRNLSWPTLSPEVVHRGGNVCGHRCL